MHAITFLQDLAVVMMVAGLVTILFHRLKQPVVLGYILAGVIIGPNTPPFPLIHDPESINTLAELGIIFLMFSLGLEFSLRKLKAVGAAAVIAATLEIILMVWVGYELGVLFGWSGMDSLFLGAMLSISSTTIIIKALAELGKTKEKFSQLVFGILIIEDILAILMIALLSGIAMTDSLNVTDLAITTGRLGVFLVASLVVGLIAVPRLIAYVAQSKSDEMLLITVLALCFGFSLLAVKLGYSVALGAFLIGAIIAEARHIGKIEQLMAPVRDMFSAVFFVAIGLLIHSEMLVEYTWPILAITLAVVVGKVITCSFGTFIAGHDPRTSLRVGMSLAQIGEFSFIIAALGLSLKVTSDFLYPIAVAVSVLTTLFTPYLIRSSDTLLGYFDRHAPTNVMESINLYSNWLGRISHRKDSSLSSRLIRKWIFQMILNAILMAAFFITAAYVARNPSAWVLQLVGERAYLIPVLWLAAMVCSLPLFVATFRKLQALAMLIGETRNSPVASRERLVILHGIPLAGISMFSLLALALSSALLPPLNILIFLIGVVVLLTFLLRRFFIRIYAKAQIALKETLAEAPQQVVGENHAPLPSILKDADLETVTIAPGSYASGKLIRELQLRTVSGASIAGIERSGTSILNPSPDEELQPNDQVLLLGTRTQLEAGKALLTKTTASQE